MHLLKTCTGFSTLAGVNPKPGISTLSSSTSGRAESVHVSSVLQSRLVAQLGVTGENSEGVS